MTVSAPRMAYVVPTALIDPVANSFPFTKPDPGGADFDRLDPNGDDVVTPDEIPDQMKPLLGFNGVKLPETITRAVPRNVRGDAQRIPATPAE
jgi:hypothetical protein